MKFSIITVVKNDKDNLLISLNSLLSQTYKDFEYIIYDGMSTDGTKSLIKKYLNKQIRYFCRKDRNYYDGLNKAIKLAKGEYIGILNAGDTYFDKNILKKIFKKLNLKKSDILFGKLKYLNNKNKVNRVWDYRIRSLNKINALKIPSPTLFIKKKILLSNPYDTTYNISSDTNFNLELSTKNFKFSFLNQYLILMKTGGLSTNPKYFLKKFYQDMIILYKHFGFIFPIIYLYKLLFKLTSFKLIQKN